MVVVDPQEESTTDNRTQVRVCKRYLRDNPADSSFQQIPGTTSDVYVQKDPVPGKIPYV